MKFKRKSPLRAYQLLAAATALSLPATAVAGDPYFAPRPALIVNQSDSVDVDVTPVDPDGDPMTVTATGLPPGMALEVTTQNWVVDTVSVNGGVVSPLAMVAAPNGDLVVSEEWPGIISRIDPSTGSKTVLNPGTVLSFARGLAMTSSSAVLVGQKHPSFNRISKLENGQITAVAGTGTGQHDGPAAQAKFDGLAALAVSQDGSVFVTQDSFVQLRLLDTAGQVSSPSGPLSGNARPRVTGLVVAPNGKLIISTNRKTVIEVDPANGYAQTTIAGALNQAGYVDGPLGTNRLDASNGLAIDPSGRTFVSEVKSIRMIDTDGTMTTIAGGPNNYGYADGTGSAVKLNYASGIASPQIGLVYFADGGNNKIRRMREFASEWAITGQYSGGNCGGSYQVLVTATDDNGDSATTSVNIKIPSQGPGCGPPPGGPPGAVISGQGARTVPDTGNPVITRPVGGASQTVPSRREAQPADENVENPEREKAEEGERKPR
ncbi:MAG: hypothetical protein ABJP70_03935 [Erythrobacter sp.]